MANENTVATEQDLKAALTELTVTGRAMMEDGIDCHVGGVQRLMINGGLVVEFAMALRTAEALVKKENGNG